MMQSQDLAKIYDVYRVRIWARKGRDQEALVVLAMYAMILRPWDWTQCEDRAEILSEQGERALRRYLDEEPVARGAVSFGELLVWACRRRAAQEQTVVLGGLPALRWERPTEDPQGCAGSSWPYDRVLIREVLQTLVELHVPSTDTLLLRVGADGTLTLRWAEVTMVIRPMAKDTPTHGDPMGGRWQEAKR